MFFTSIGIIFVVLCLVSIISLFTNIDHVYTLADISSNSKNSLIYLPEGRLLFGDDDDFSLDFKGIKVENLSIIAPNYYPSLINNDILTFNQNDSFNVPYTSSQFNNINNSVALIPIIKSNNDTEKIEKPIYLHANDYDYTNEYSLRGLMKGEYKISLNKTFAPSLTAMYENKMIVE